jgi:hypothetical protein
LWIPYRGTNISIENFGFHLFINKATHHQFHSKARTQKVDNKANVRAILQQVKSMTSTELQRRLDLVRDVRDYYTYEGTLKQIFQLFQDPFGSRGGYLQCAGLPEDIL